MDQRIIDLYDEYTHAPLERRVFIKRLTALAGSTAGAMAALPLLESNYAFAATIAPDDARIDANYVTYPGASGPIRAYLARPKGSAKQPAVVVIHENRGLTPHIEDVARRVALEGYIALAPDMLSPFGGTPADEDAGRQLFTKVNRAAAVTELVAGASYVKGRPDTTGRIGCVGLDDRVNAGIPAYEAALKSAGVRYTKHMYDGTQHAFHNEMAGARYNKEAAELAWRRTIEFLHAELR